MTDEAPIDLSALRTAGGESSEDRVIRTVMQRIGGEMPRDAAVLMSVLDLARPALIAAALIIGAGSAIVVRAERTRTAKPATIWDSLGLPPALERSGTTGAVDASGLLRDLGGRL